MIDLARFVGAGELTTALDAALRDGLTSEDLLHRRIASLRSSGRYGIPLLLAVIEGSEITRGGHSWLERRFLELCASANLPRPLTQQVLSRAQDRLVRVDCRFPGSAVDRRADGLPLASDGRPDGPRCGALRTRCCSMASSRCSSRYAHVTLDADWVFAQVTAALTQVAA